MPEKSPLRGAGEGGEAGKRVSPLYIHFRAGQMKVSKCERPWESRKPPESQIVQLIDVSSPSWPTLLHFFQSLVTGLFPGAMRGKSPTPALPSGLDGCALWLRVAA